MFARDNKRNSYTFGLARELFKKVYMKHLLPNEPNVPGPGKYQHKELIGKIGEKYTMRMKTSIEYYSLLI